MRRVEFGDRVTGRVVNTETWRAIRPPRTVTGVVVAMFPKAPHIVMVITPDEESLTLRLQGATT